MNRLITADPWQALRRYTPARIALGRAGDSLPTKALLEFGLAHAQARDAVHEPSHQGQLREQLQAQGLDVIAVHSAATDRHQYLLRPDLGRHLNEASRAQLIERAPSLEPDIVFVVADGLSSLAPLRHGPPLLQILHAELREWHIGPVIVAELARVALGDEIGELLRAKQLAILIGERPGLSAPDSLGIYLTHAPRVGRTDAERNCISNVRPEGLGYALAAHKLLVLLCGARRLGRSGVALKDESEAASIVAPARRARIEAGAHGDDR